MAGVRLTEGNKMVTIMGKYCKILQSVLYYNHRKEGAKPMKKMYNVTNGTHHLEVSVEELTLLITATEDQRKEMIKTFKGTKDKELKKWLEKHITMMDKMLEAMRGV